MAYGLRIRGGGGGGSSSSSSSSSSNSSSSSISSSNSSNSNSHSSSWGILLFMPLTGLESLTGTWAALSDSLIGMKELGKEFGKQQN